MFASEAIGEIRSAPPELSAVAIKPPVRPGWRERVAYPVAVGVAAAVHIGVVALMWPSSSDAVGDGGTTLEAIAVSVVARVPVMSAPAPPSPETSGELVLLDEPQPDTTPFGDPKMAEQKPSSPPRAVIAPPPELEPLPDAVTLPAMLPEPQSEHRHDAAVAPPREVEMARQQTASATPPLAAPVAAFTAAEASPGAVKAYERRISQLLEARKPSGKGVRGRLLIQLVIDGEGRPQSAIVLRSSAKPALDERVLAAVQRVEFPRPPAAMTTRQLTFNLPYEYR